MPGPESKQSPAAWGVVRPTDGMNAIHALLKRKLSSLDTPMAVVLPDGQRVGAAQARVTLTLRDLASLAHIATGEVGRVAEDHVVGRLDFDGSVRNLMAVAAQMIEADPTRASADRGPLGWWRGLARHKRSREQHQADADARQVQFHYDVSDDFYAL